MYRIKILTTLIAALSVAILYAVTPVDFSNIVGYQTKTIINGYSFNTPTFVDVGTNVLNIQNFKLSKNASGDSTETIQLLDKDGMLLGIYTWLNETVGMEPGWYDYMTWEFVSTNIPAAVGYFMHANKAVSAKVIGELKLDETTVTLPLGFSVFGNNIPREISLQDIRLGGDATGDGTEMIQFLDNTGNNTDNWAWRKTSSGVVEDGWYDSNGLVQRTVKPGEAFLIYVGTGSQDQRSTKNVTITFPSSIEKK